MRGTASHDRIVLAGAALFVAAHVATLPRHLEDIDSINFALGLRDYDIAAHQPHPPGYPVFILAARVALMVVAPWATGFEASAALAMALLSALAGGAALLALYGVVRAAGFPSPLMSVALTAVAPLFWITALRPLSDMAGLAGALCGQWLVWRAVQARLTWRAVVLAAFVCGLTVGLRSQVAWLVAGPLLWLAWKAWRHAGIARAAGAAAGAVAGVLSWAVPMIVLTGGVHAYRDALASQAGEDFEGVPMLVLQPGVRRLAQALADTFVWPWGWWPLAAVMIAVAVAGVFALRHRLAPAAWLAIGFGPYLGFHLLFQETETARYALPLVPVVTTLVAMAVARGTGRFAWPLVGVLCVAAAAVSVHAQRQYASAGMTVGETLAAMEREALAAPERPHVVMHRRVWAETRRARSALAPQPAYDVAPAPRAFEWKAAASLWQRNPETPVWWLIDPRRGDDVAIDPRARRPIQQVAWPSPLDGPLGGMRPHPFDWTRFDRPQWVLLDGWALTPELAGLTAVASGDTAARATAIVRRTPGGATLVVGGRHVAAAGGASQTLRVQVGDPAASDSWQAEVAVPPGSFAFTWTLPGAPSAPDGFVPLRVEAPGETRKSVYFEQFDHQALGTPVVALERGWYEPERDVVTGRRWRWVGDESGLRVVGSDSAVELVVSGTYPRHYDRSPVMEIVVGDRVVGRHTLPRPFRIAHVLSADGLRAADGRVTWRVTPSFVAGERTGTADARRLALEIAALHVRAVR